jgi:hypothetical protein
MKCIVLSLVTILIFGCSSNFTINTSRIHSNKKFTNGFTLHKISVDSLDYSGKPKAYKIDSSFHCNLPLKLDNKAFEVFVQKSSLLEYRNLNKILDSLKLHDKESYRNEDTIKIFGTTYIPSGVKRSKYYYETIENIERIKITRNNYKFEKTIYFKRENKFYHWSASNKKDNIRNNVKNIIFLNNTWYCTFLESSYGLLSSGTKTIFLHIDNQGNIERFVVDDIKEGQ